MPNVRAMRVDKNWGISITASDGRSITLLKAEISTIYASKSGNASAKMSATITDIKGRIETALGAEQVPQSIIAITPDATFKDIIGMEITG